MNKSTLSKIDISEDIIEGKKLAGDDIAVSQLLSWYKEEEEFFNNKETKQYALNTEKDYFYEYLRSLQFKLPKIFKNESLIKTLKILCIGPGDGEEVRVIKNLNTKNLIFIESSPDFIDILKKKFNSSKFLKSNPMGDFDLKNNSIDVVICYSVLHHIPNVSKILKECYRVLNENGTLLIREPCSSMGDWKNPNRKCSPNERGISKNWMCNQLKQIGFSKIKFWPIAFLPLSKIFKVIGFQSIITSSFYFYLDLFFSIIISFNNKYFRKSNFEKLAPSAFFYEIKKN